MLRPTNIPWLGEIPYEWDIIKLKYSSLLKGRIGWQGLTTDEYQNEGPYLVTGTDFENGAIAWDRCQHVSEERYKLDIAIQIKENDLLITKDGTIGKVAVSKNCPDKVCLNSGVFIIRNSGKYKYNSRFMYYVLQSDELQLWFSFNDRGNSTVKHLTQDKFYNFSFAYPPLSEQQAIADYLDDRCSKIDEIIAEATASIEEYKELKQAVIYEAVTKGLDKNVPMKDSGIEWIGAIPQHWHVTIVRRYCSFQTGKTPSTNVLEWFDGDVNWFTPGDFNEDYYLVDSRRKLSQKALVDSAAIRIPAECVMIVGIGSIGKVGITSVSCSCNQQITAVCSSVMYPKYLMYYLELSGKYLKDTAMFTLLPILNNNTLGNSPLIVPNINEQKQIADYLDDKLFAINALIKEKRVLIDDMNLYKKSLIYEIVTGKKRVII